MMQVLYSFKQDKKEQRYQGFQSLSLKHDCFFLCQHLRIQQSKINSQTPGKIGQTITFKYLSLQVNGLCFENEFFYFPVRFRPDGMRF